MYDDDDAPPPERRPFLEDRPLQIKAGILGVVLLAAYLLIPFPWSNTVDAKAWTRTETVMVFVETQGQGWKEADNLTESLHRDPDESGGAELPGIWSAPLSASGRSSKPAPVEEAASLPAVLTDRQEVPTVSAAGHRQAVPMGRAEVITTRPSATRSPTTPAFRSMMTVAPTIHGSGRRKR